MNRAIEGAMKYFNSLSEAGKKRHVEEQRAWAEKLGMAAYMEECVYRAELAGYSREEVMSLEFRNYLLGMLGAV